MKTRPTQSPGFHWPRFLVAAVLAIFTLGELRAVDISGTYENFGSMVIAATDKDAGTISLQGLFNQEFDYAAARLQDSHVDRVVIQQTSNHVTIECWDDEGKVTRGVRWKRGAGYDVTDSQVNLIVGSRRSKDHGYVFSISNVTDQHLLQVTVNYLQPTALGPVPKPLGTFLFSPVLANRAKS